MSTTYLDLPAGVVWAEAEIEREVTVEARRRAEHRAGRRAATAALGALGRSGPVIATGGAPWFPADAVGSITHDADLAAALVAAPDAGFASVGADLHHEQAIEPGAATYVAGPAELAIAERISGAGAVHVVFALKEAVFKAHSAATGAWLEFGDIEMELAAHGAATLHSPAWTDAVLRWHRAEGRIRAAVLLRSTAADGVPVGRRDDGSA